MISNRDAFHDFINEIGLKGALKVDSVQTKALDSKLRFDRIEKFAFMMLDSRELSKIIDYCDTNELGMYMSFDHMCIGYPASALNHKLEVF